MMIGERPVATRLRRVFAFIIDFCLVLVLSELASICMGLALEDRGVAVEPITDYYISEETGQRYAFDKVPAVAGIYTRERIDARDRMVQTCRVRLEDIGDNVIRRETDSASCVQHLEEIPNWAGILVVFLYFAVMEASKLQGTVGKAALGLKISNAAGQRIGFKSAAIRTAIKMFPVPILMLLGPLLGTLPGTAIQLMILSTLGASFLMMMFRQSRQSVHDTLAQTYVTGLPPLGKT